MSQHLVQITEGKSRRVALVEGPNLRILQNHTSVYEIALHCARTSQSMASYIQSIAGSDLINFDEVYSGESPWKLMAPIDVPGEPSRLLISGTGLTHIGSALQRQAMHLSGQTKEEEVLTDSMRMFQWGLEQGRPAKDAIGIAPEWFYKGDGSMLRGPFELLDIPSHAEDGGEEAEIAGVYLVDDAGAPLRIGMTQGNEFSDHRFEKRNYLNLAGSKLRTCSVGPELVVDADFRNVHGHVQITRGQRALWERDIASGEENMSHSLANIEHHHFKFAGHRQPGGVHVHFFGADALSFGDAIELKEEDVIQVRFDGFGRPLQNSIRRETTTTQPVRVRSLA